ncbi:hypothetical protein AAFF_G00197800 [Aldrovandia affinis]|uniref:CCHC-type domain-containing protein n=1 Tax=Aldrovandia affinis TaxID=143900 RepID=A0AAD7W650_9TELE|nr:hypothetical protein AAFF_G00197800 [Aldrovandia affinis]
MQKSGSARCYRCGGSSHWANECRFAGGKCHNCRTDDQDHIWTLDVVLQQLEEVGLHLKTYLFVPEVSAARVYDRQTLLGIRSSMVEFHAFTKLDVFQPPFVRSLVPLPSPAWRLPPPKPPQTPEEERETSWNTDSPASGLCSQTWSRPAGRQLPIRGNARSAWVDAKQTPGACALCPGLLLRLLLLGP